MHICERRTRPGHAHQGGGGVLGGSVRHTCASVMAAKRRGRGSGSGSGVAIVDRSAWFDSAKCAANIQQQQQQQQAGKNQEKLLKNNFKKLL